MVEAGNTHTHTHVFTNNSWDVSSTPKEQMGFEVHKSTKPEIQTMVWQKGKAMPVEKDGLAVVDVARLPCRWFKLGGPPYTLST